MSSKNKWWKQLPKIFEVAIKCSEDVLYLNEKQPKFTIEGL